MYVHNVIGVQSVFFNCFENCTMWVCCRVSGMSCRASCGGTIINRSGGISLRKISRPAVSVNLRVRVVLRQAALCALVTSGLVKFRKKFLVCQQYFLLGLNASHEHLFES